MCPPYSKKYRDDNNAALPTKMSQIVTNANLAHTKLDPLSPLNHQVMGHWDTWATPEMFYCTSLSLNCLLSLVNQVTENKVVHVVKQLYSVIHIRNFPRQALLYAVQRIQYNCYLCYAHHQLH